VSTRTRRIKPHARVAGSQTEVGHPFDCRRGCQGWFGRRCPLLWAEESAKAIEDWWLSPRGDDQILECLKALALAVESDRLFERYMVTELAGDRSEYAVQLPLDGVIAVIEIFGDRVELLNILHDHHSEDDYPLP
jgi:hypothetical protein